MRPRYIDFSNPEEHRAWKEGYNACEEMMDGSPVKKNPYEGKLAEVWDQGWEDAEYDNEN